MARNSSDGCIGQILLIPIFFLGAFIVDTCNNTQSSLMEDGKYETYIEKYPNGDYVEAALDSIYSKATSYDKPEYHIAQIYNKANSENIKGTRIEKKLKEYVFNVVSEQNQQYFWDEYLKVADPDDAKIAEEKKSELENKEWGTDELAWNTAVKSNHPYSYKKYMDLYPRGKHYKKAKESYVKLSVAMDSKGEHNELPSMDKVSSGGSRTTISISNSTNYELNVFYSGPDYETASIPAGSSRSITIPNGTYNISARVSDHSVRPCYGTETVTGGHYSVSYYISSSRY